MQIIIHKDVSGNMRRFRPTEEALSRFGIDHLAKKNVAAGQPYKIVDHLELPENWQERDAWEVDDNQLDDGVGWPIAKGSDWEVVEYLSDGKMLVEKRQLDAEGNLNKLGQKIFNPETEQFEEVQ